MRHGQAWDNTDRLALCAALLHDLHGPFSHSFEKYLIQTMAFTQAIITGELC